jgi:hypothetical protein
MVTMTFVCEFFYRNQQEPGLQFRANSRTNFISGQSVQNLATAYRETANNVHGPSEIFAVNFAWPKERETIITLTINHVFFIMVLYLGQN